MPDVPPPLPIAQPISLIEFDVACRHCGYNLRTLGVDAICPECATPVAESLKSDLLCFADANWVRALRRGLRLCLVGTLVALAFTVAWISLTAFSLAPATIRSWETTYTLCQAATQITVTVGIWFLTRPDPQGFGDARHRILRRLTLIFSLLSLCAIPYMLLARWVSLTLYISATTWYIGLVLFNLVNLACFGCLSSLLARQAQRLPSPSIAQGFRVYLWILVIVSIGAQWRYVAIIYSMINRTSMSWMYTLGTVTFLTSLAVIAVKVLFSFLLFRMSARLDRLLAQSRVSRSLS